MSQFIDDLEKHERFVAATAKAIAIAMNMPQDDIERVFISGIYHDEGKKKLPQDIINKPDTLTTNEFQIVKTHIYLGSNALKSHKNILYRECSKFVLMHHENYDGSGYLRVKGNDIPVVSRILRVADVYCALTTDRCYRQAFNTEIALNIMKSERNSFDPYIYDVFAGIIKNIITPNEFNDLQMSI